jgi:butyrate kinase
MDIGKEEVFYSVLDQKTLVRSGKCRYGINESAEAAAETILNEICGSVFERVLLPGGLLRPISCNSFFVNDRMLFDAQNHVYGKSEYNFLTVVAHHIAVALQIPAIAIKPLSSDALKSCNRINGIREIDKKSRYLACRHHGA